MDWGTVTNTSCTDMPSVDQLLETMHEFRRKHPRPDNGVDVIVMREADLRILKGQCLSPSLAGFAQIHGQMPGVLWGLPIESYPTQRECADRAIELKEHGKRVGLVVAEAAESHASSGASPDSEH